MSYAATVLADNPIIYWKLDESAGAATVIDYSTSGNHGETPVNNGLGAGRHPLLDSTSYYPPGVSPQWITSISEVNITGTQDRSVEVWLKDSVYGQNAILYLGAPAGNQLWMLADKVAPGEFAVYGYSNDLVFYTGTDKSKWHHLVVTLQGEVCSLYVNGKLQGSQLHTGLITPLSRFRVGGYEGWTSAPYRGDISHVSLYDYALTSEQITNHLMAASNEFAGSIGASPTHLVSGEGSSIRPLPAPAGFSVGLLPQGTGSDGAPQLTINVTRPVGAEPNVLDVTFSVAPRVNTILLSPATYIMDPPLEVLNVELINETTVRLTTEEQTIGTEYTLEVATIEALS